MLHFLQRRAGRIRHIRQLFMLILWEPTRDSEVMAVTIPGDPIIVFLRTYITRGAAVYKVRMAHSLVTVVADIRGI